jgi:hypothetical protein
MSDPIQNDLALAEFSDESTALVPTRPNATGINIGGNTVTQGTEHLPEEQKLTLRALHTIARDEKWSWAETVRQSGIHNTVLYRLWHGSYRYPLIVKERHCHVCRKNVDTNRAGGCAKCGARNDMITVTEKPHPKAGEQIPLSDEVCNKLSRWKAKFDAVVATDDDFVETSVWKRIEGVARRAFKRRKMALVLGESQIGKTTAGKHLAKKYNSGATRYVDTPPSPGKQMMLKVIAKALTVSPNTCFDNLLQDVIAALDPSKQLVIDNFHRVLRTYQRGSVVACMDMILYIFDQTQCSIVVMATPQFGDAIRNGEFSQYLKQFDRRFLYPLWLEDEPEPGDLMLIARKAGLRAECDSKTGDWVYPNARTEVAVGKDKTAKPLEIVQHIAHTDGFGKFCARLGDAADLAEAKGIPISWELFVKAHHIAEKLATQPAKRKANGGNES